MGVYSCRWDGRTAKIRVTPDFVSVWYFRPLDSYSIAWAGACGHNSVSARLQTPRSRFMRQSYDSALLVSMPRLRLIALFSVALPLAAALHHPVRVESGLLAGAAGSNPSGTVFKGVPFAAPPVGD